VIPDGYVGVVVADTRRALQWEAGLRAAGFDAVRVETTGADAEKGTWRVTVPRKDELAAKALVSDVVSGRARLPSRPLLSRTAWIALIAIAAFVTVITIVALLH